MKTQTKIIIRKLPKSLTEEEFLTQIHPYFQFNYFRFCEANVLHDNFASTRAYIDFKNQEEMYAFKKDMECKTFCDSEGNESYGIIEFSVFQKIPEENKLDSKENTLLSDPDFIKFQKELNISERSVTVSAVEANLEEIKAKESEKAPHTKTALLDYISNMNKKERSINRKDDQKRQQKIIPLNKKEPDNVESVTEKKISKEEKSYKKEVVSNSKVKGQETKKVKPSKRSDIRAYAAAYEENEYETRKDDNRGSRNSYYGNWQQPYEEDYPRYNKNSSKNSNYGSRRMGGDSYSQSYDYYGYKDYYGRNAPNVKSSGYKKSGPNSGVRRPPSYSATRKE